MPTLVICSNAACSARYTVAEDKLGRQLKCKKCGTSFTASLPISLPLPSS